MLRRIGLSSRFAFSSASLLHGNQSTGLSACWSRYGLVSLASRLGTSWSLGDRVRAGHLRREIVGASLGRLVRTVGDDVHFFERDETAANHLVEGGEDLIYLLLGLHALDDNWEIERQIEKSRGVNPAAGAETHDAARDGCSGVVPPAKARDNLPL